MSEVLNKRKVVIFGIGQQADLAHYYFEEHLVRQVIAYTVDFDYESKSKNDLPVFHLDSIEDKIDVSNTDFFVAIGAIGLNLVRKHKFELLRKKNYSLINNINPKNYLNKIKVGTNIYVDQQYSIHPYVTIEDNVCLLNSQIGHHTIIKKHSSVINSTIGANCIIEEGCFIGMETIVMSGVKIGKYSIVHAGSIVKKDVPEYSVVAERATNNLRKIDSRRVKLLGLSYNNYEEMI